MVSKHEYLGAVLSYSRPEDATIQKRVAAAKAAFDRLKTVLTSRSLALDLRTRLWATCVVSSLLYAIPQVGLTKSGAAKLNAVFHKQLRHITRSPVHLGFVSNAELRQARGLEDPILELASRASRGRPDTVPTDSALAR